ncbi:DUF4112 domain-containing protein [Mesorhizobium sp. M0514]|uniref:DUF4112 domain-containing protein n=1 Tax=Mesorhizobium sp. M0514 TaxID=2956955 RepID=UPI003335060B
MIGQGGHGGPTCRVGSIGRATRLPLVHSRHINLFWTGCARRSASSKRRCRKWVVARMLGNVLLDTLVGSVPILGSIFDVYFKANNRNIRLLRRHLNKVIRTGPAYLRCE